MRKYQIVFIIFLLTFIAAADENLWTTNGPYSACVTTIAIDPSDNNCLFIGTVENGMYYTVDSGQNWAHIESDVLPRTIRNIVFNPLHPDTIWAATIESCYRSVNHGVDWERIYFPVGWHYEINALAIHPLWTNIIFAGGPWFSGINYVSMDGGQSWDRLSLTVIVAENFIIDPVNDSTIYATSHTCTSRKSVFKSIDLGTTWTNIHSNLDTTTVIYNLAIDHVDNNIIYACGNDWTSSGKCVYKSVDGGESWMNISPDGLISDRVFNIYVSPHDHNTVFICTRANGVLRSTDGGSSWEEVNNGLTGRFAYRTKYDPVSDTYFLGVFYNGIYRSTTNGSSWEKISYNIPNTNCNDYAVVSNNPAKQFICAVNGLYQTNDYGQHWEYVDVLSPDYNRETSCIVIDPLNSNNIFIGLCYGYSSPTILRSQNGGVSWEEFSDGLPDGDWFNRLRIGHYDGYNMVFLSAGNALYKSDDSGESWYRDYGVPAGIYMALDLSPANNDYIYTGGYEAYGSRDGGLNWDELNTPDIGTGFINEIICHPYNHNELYMCIYSKGVYKSIDGGVSWEDITNNLPYASNFIYFTGMAINPLNTDNMFIYSFDYGVFQSHDGGENWEAFNEGLNIHCGMAITIVDPLDTNRIYLATYEQSAWSITRAATDVDDDVANLPWQFDVTAYPNPFNAAVNISFSLPTAGEVRGDIYDLLGRHVATVVDEYLFPGYHTFSLKPQGLSSGQYYLRLSAGNQVHLQKMLFIK